MIDHSQPASRRAAMEALASLCEYLHIDEQFRPEVARRVVTHAEAGEAEFVGLVIDAVATLDEPYGLPDDKVFSVFNVTPGMAWPASNAVGGHDAARGAEIGDVDPRLSRAVRVCLKADVWLGRALDGVLRDRGERAATTAMRRCGLLIHEGFWLIELCRAVSLGCVRHQIRRAVCS